MTVFAAKSTKDIWHKGKKGNVYQLDSILNQLNIEKKLLEAGFQINYVDSKNREKEAENLVSLVHKKGYLNVFNQKAEKETYLSNGLMLQESLYPLVLEHALIAKEIVDSALENYAFSTIGGGHHCEYEKPLGFGLVNNMAISAIYASSLGNRVAVLDLDTHYSNGCNDLLRNKKNILMCSLWNQVIPAWKYFDSQNNLVHEKVTNITEYFGKLNIVLEEISRFKPSLFIYHLGFDVLETDRMGGIVGMDEAKLLEREIIVKRFLDAQRIPFIIYRGGGYINYGGNIQTQEARRENLIRTQVIAIEQYLSK